MPARFLTIFLSLLISFAVRADESVPAVPVKLIVQNFSVDNKNYLAVSFENYPEWHTYWKNPGDAGLAIKNQFSIKKKEIKLTELEWPAPKRFIENGTQWAYGYTDSYTLFYKLDKSDINKLSGKDITLSSSWLVCRHICVPGQKEIQFKIVGGKVSSSDNMMAPLTDLELGSRFMNLPKADPMPEYLELKLSKGAKEKTLILTYEVKKNTDVGFLKDSNLLYSFPSPPFDFGHENLTVKEASIMGIVEINWDGEYSTPPQPLPASGKFEKPYTIKFLFNDPVQRKVIVVEKKFTGFDLTTTTAPAETTPPSAGTTEDTKVNAVDMPKVTTVTQSNSLIYYLALAFIGGLILNVMPCVLPVISLKLFGLVKYRNESRAVILRHNFFYTLGILTTFIILGFVVLAFKSLGTQVGWGFQLQSPNFIAVMIIALFVFSLNMFGMFEFITPGGKHLGNIQTQEGFAGDFLSGVLATILSTPCSAPFLGTALTFAFTSSNATIFLIFIMIGLGLAFPFIMTGFVPEMVSFLPRPGNWMNNVKKFLGLTLILTMIWLFDVYNALVDGSAQLVKLATVCAIVFFGIALMKRGKKNKEKWFSGITFLVALLLFVNLSTSTVVASKDEQTALIRDKKARGLNWEPWSVERMNDYKENHQVVFIDFTAKWCFTCKVNERLVLDTDEFKKFVTENNIRLLIGDWTKRDEVIGSFLKENGLVGVPAYFIQKKDGTLIGLGETVSIERIKSHLN